MSKNKIYSSLEEIKKDKLVVEIMKQIMIDISDHKLIYLNESQFQFDLAWRVNEHICKNSGINIHLEYYSMTDNSNGISSRNKFKKFFTDILIIDQNGNYIPIELKYKKHNMETKINGTIQTLDYDGASDCGRFYYLWDIHRIEQLTQKERIKQFENKINLNKFIENKKFICGYAIMITNEKSYWNKDNTDNCAANMTLCQPIDAIRWKHSDIGVESIIKSSTFFKPLIEDNTKDKEVERKYMPLSKSYNFSGSCFLGKKISKDVDVDIVEDDTVDIITVRNYDCTKTRNKEIKAFIAKI